MFRKVIGLSLFFLFSTCPFLQAKESLLPVNLPKELNKPEIRNALETWSKLNTDRHQNYSHFVRKYDKQIKGQTWYLIYSRIRFNIHDEKVSVEALEKQIHETFKTFNKAGSEIRVLFVPYVEIYKFSVFQKSLGEALDSNDETKLEWTKVKILNPFDPIWFEKNQLDDSYNVPMGQSICKGNATYISSLYNLTHELNHMLLWNADAYKENASVNIGDPIDREVFFTADDAKTLENLLNAENCWSSFMTSLEIYVGLKRMGIEALGWNDYVNRTYGFASIGGELHFYYRPKEQVEMASMSARVYDMNGNLIVDEYYSFGYGYAKLEKDFPRNVHLENGNYIVDVQLNETIKIEDGLVLGKSGEEFFISYKNKQKIVVANGYSFGLR